MFSSFFVALLIGGLLYGRVSAMVNGAICVCLMIFLVVTKKGGKHTGAQLQHVDMLAQRSWILRWNTGLKVCGSVVLLLFCLVADSFAVAVAVAVCTTVINLVANRVALTKYISLLTLPITFMALSGFALLLDVSPRPLGWLDIPFLGRYLSITRQGQAATALLLVKAFGGLCCLYMLSLSTPMYEITSFLRRVHVPAVLVELTVLIYRYIFVLLSSLHTMTAAAHARQGYRTYRNMWRSFGGIASNLLACSFARVSRNFDAMEARGYDGEMRFLERIQRPKIWQVAGVAVLLAIPAAVWLIERGWR